ncbi:MAG: ABC transporter permease [Metamycoplasmataceae bacterium]
MSKLFKEILKSFSKTKTLLIGLIVLIFLSSGVFTLLSDVNKNYSNQFDDYKRISKIHDLTVDTEIAATGERPSDPYIAAGYQEKIEYVSVESVLDTKKAIRFPKNQIETYKNEGYIKISKLSIVGSEENHNYLKVKDLYRFMETNKIADSVDPTTGLVESRSFSSTPLQEYISPGVPIPNSYSLKASDKITNFKFADENIKLGDLVSIVPGSTSLLNPTDDRLTNIKGFFINASTHEATISQTKKEAWEKQGLLITITPEQTARLLGFTKDNEGRGSIYKVDGSLRQTGVFAISSPSGFPRRWRFTSSMNKTIINGGFSINLNGTINNDINKNNVNQFFTFDQNFVVPNSWIALEKTTYEYERYYSKLNYDFSNNDANSNKLWTKNYQDYMNKVSQNLDDENYLSKVSFWKKTQIIEIVENDRVTVIDPSETIKISQLISSDDLNRRLVRKTSKINSPRSPSNFDLNRNSILWIERETGFISQSDIDLILRDPNGDTATKVRTTLNNTNAKNERIQRIDSGAKAIAQEALYQEILTLVGDIKNIALRENITTSGFLDGVANTFHFVNVGNENKEIKLNNDILIEQNVGKLYNEETTKSLLFELSSKDDISSSQVPETYIFKILDVMFDGMSVDKNYINPIITFEDYEYVPYNNASTKNSNKALKKTNAKIVRMKDSLGNIIGVTKQAPNSQESKGKFYLLKEQLVDGKKIWVADKPLNFNGSDEDFQKYILLKNLNFADTTTSGNSRRIVGQNGWAKRNINYENKYSIPFQILIPNAEIIDNWQESNNFNVFRDRLINSLTAVVEPLISPRNLEILISSATASFAKNGFADVLSFPSKIENRKLQKTIFGVFHEGATHSEDSFWNEFIDEILGNIIAKADTDPNYLDTQIENIDNLLKLMLGSELDLSSITKFINSPKELLIGLRKIIASINIDETIIQVWNKFYDVEIDKYRVVGVGDILPILLNNISNDSSNPNIGFKLGLKHIINQVNFSKVIKHVRENVLDSASLELFGPILEQLNSNLGKPDADPNNDYINMNTGFSKIIDLIDINAFSLNVANNSTVRSFWINNIDGEEQEYRVNSLSISGIFASLLNSLGKNNDNDLALHNAMIEMLNISSKTAFEGFLGIGLYQPIVDPNKLDIRDLQSMLKSQTPELNDLKTALEKLSIDLTKPNFFLDPESTVGQYLTNYIFDFAGDISIQNKDIKKKVDTYLKFMNETVFINFDPNLIVSGSSTLGGNITNPTEPNSLADKFINMINPNTRPSAGGLLDTVMTQVYNEFYNENNQLQERDMTTEILGFYSFWMKLSDLNLNAQSSTTTNQVIDQINLLVNKTLDGNSEIGKILNTTSKSFVGSAMNYKILDGFSNVKETAVRLANLSEEVLIANGLSPEVINYYFGHDGEKLKINNNTIALVSALSSIINVQNTSDLSRANLVTDDFIKLFLPRNKDEANSMLTMGQRTLNTLSGTTNTIIESLGISSVILNPFSAVLNAPTLLWFTVNQGALSESADGNLSYIIRDKLYRFDSTDDKVGIGYDGFKGLIDSLLGEETYIDNPNDMDEFIALSLDKDYLEYLSSNTFKDSDIFGVNISDALLAGVGSFVETRTDDFQIVISDVGSYLVKINEAYLTANNKSAYDLTSNNTPKDSIEMQTLLNSLDDKYKINVNGLEYLIIGTDSTVDYLYPVTDLNNIQVDTKSQAILYVNQTGFDRARESNANAVVNKYFLIVASPTISPIDLRDQINRYIYTSLTGLDNYDELSNQEKNNTAYKKAYLYNESNPFNPEIALRVQTIETLIQAINRANSFISMTLLLLIGLVTIFVIKRYISSRSKVLGILKAQGYKSLQIAISICTFALFVCFFGATLGYITGHFLQLPMMHIFSTYWTLPIATTNFNLVSLLVTVLMPLVGLILLTIITTLFLLRVKPTKLMDGSFQLNNSRVAGAIQKKFHSSNIKSKFTLSLTLNSIWKLLSLLVSLVFTVTIMSFSFASQNAFGNAVTKTYKNRNYNYKIDLITPTLEGGSITTLDKQDIHNLLYVPVGNPNEGATYLADYFAPGPNSVINPLLPNGIHPNGQPLYNDKHVVSKSSFDLVVNIGGIETNVWNSLFNSMPDSQRASVVAGSQSAAKWLEWSQGLVNYGQDNEAKFDENGEKIPYFKYIINHDNPEESRFVYRNLNEATNEYFHQEIVISGEVTNIRETYREFLVEAYNKSLNYNSESPEKDEPAFIKDYFLTFGSVVFDKEKNEKFSYANTVEKNDESFNPIINGYDKDSEQVQILDKKENNLLHLTSKIWNESTKETIPVIINHVVKDKRNLNIGSKVELTVLNTANRFTESIKQKLNNLGASLEPSKKTTWTFEVVGINETFINEEWTTSQEIINHITYLDELSQPGDETPFNGILSNEESPRQANESLGLYSENGYWSANEKIDLFSENLSTEQQEKNKNIFRELFYKVNPSNPTIINNSVFAKTLRMISGSDLSHAQESNLIKLFLDIDPNIQLSQVLNPGNEVIINKSLERFSELYSSNNILGPSFKDIQSKNIESGFISNTTDSINSVSAVVIVLSLLISVTILIMISSLIVNENERNVAIFSILGYNNREKSILFFSLYIPIIILAILLSIPLTMALITFFSGFVNTSILISLAMSLRATDVLISTLFVSAIFGFSSLIAWFGLNRIKPIVLLKEGD